MEDETTEQYRIYHQPAWDVDPYTTETDDLQKAQNLVLLLNDYDEYLNSQDLLSTTYDKNDSVSVIEQATGTEWSTIE